MIAPTPAAILEFLLDGARAGIEGVLITLTGISGTASRGIGTQMAVLEDGRHLGSFSGGCIEAAVIAEARAALAVNGGRMVRYGVGSPYLDIRLPCGGGIDLVFTPRPDSAALANVLAQMERRESAALCIRETGVSLADAAGTDCFQRTYAPPLRLVALGNGEDLTAIVRLARAFGLAVEDYAPGSDPQTSADPATTPLVSRTQLPPLKGDAWTAFVFLFHDHDWEEHLVPHALAQEGFYHGAVGSARTHRARLEGLRAAGVPQEQLSRLRGGIGLIPATRDPATLALSILGELVQDYQACAAMPGWAAHAPHAAHIPTRR